MESTIKRQYSLSARTNELQNYLRTNICMNIPNIHRDIRIHILDEIYYLTRNIYCSTYNKGNIRMKYLIELKVNISMLDNLLSQLIEMKCVNDKKINTAISKLNDIKNIIYGWIFNEENKKN